MGDAQVRGDKRFEADGVERRPHLPERSPHHAQMDAADDVPVLPRKRPERAMAKADRVADSDRPLRGEARVVEQRDDAIDGLGGGWRGSHVGGHRPAPAFPGAGRGGHRVGLEGELVGEDPGEFAISVGVGIPVLRLGNVPEARSPAARRWGDAAGDEPRIDELVELLAHGARVEADGLGELAHPDRTVSLAEDGEESGAGQPGEDTVAVLWRCHGLHFARKWT